MNRDPIVEETRRLRSDYARRHGNDPDAIFADIRRRESRATQLAVSCPPHPARCRPSPAESHADG